MPLLPYQEEPCERLTKILKEKGSALDASDTGTGKTYCAVHAALRLGLPTGIVCPKSVIPSWERVCAAEGLKPAFILNYEKLNRGHGNFVVRSGKQYEWNFQGMIIWDEVHRAKAMNTLNAKMLIAAWRTQHIRCLCLSATAARNPCEMRALGYVLGLHKGFDYFHWIFKYGAKKNRWNGVEWRGTPAQLEEIHHRIFPERGVRVRVKDLGDAFPENQIIAESVAIDDPEGLDAVYSEAKTALAELKEKQKDDFPNAMTIILRARQKAELLKVPVLVEMAKDLIDEGKSVVVFSCFNRTIELLSEYLETKCIVWGMNRETTMAQSSEERQKNIDEFQSGTSKIILCNIQAGGVGISLHDLDGFHPRVALLCPTFDAVSLKQALGRIHRSGGKSKCLQKIVFAAGTVEEKVCKKVQAKLNDIETLNDGDVEGELTWHKSTTQ